MYLNAGKVMETRLPRSTSKAKRLKTGNLLLIEIHDVYKRSKITPVLLSAVRGLFMHTDSIMNSECKNDDH